MKKLLAAVLFTALATPALAAEFYIVQDADFSGASRTSCCSVHAMNFLVCAYPFSESRKAAAQGDARDNEKGPRVARPSCSWLRRPGEPGRINPVASASGDGREAQRRRPTAPV